MARQSHDYKAQILLFRRFVPPPLLFFATRFHLFPSSPFFFPSLFLPPPFSLSSLHFRTFMRFLSVSLSFVFLLAASPFLSVLRRPRASILFPAALSAGYFIIQLLSFAWQKAPLPTTYRTTSDDEGGIEAKDRRVIHLISSPPTKSDAARSPRCCRFSTWLKTREEARKGQKYGEFQSSKNDDDNGKKVGEENRRRLLRRSPAAFPRPREESVAVANP